MENNRANVATRKRELTGPERVKRARLRKKREAEMKRRRIDAIMALIAIAAMVALCIMISKSAFGATNVDCGPENAYNADNDTATIAYVEPTAGSMPEAIVVEDIPFEVDYNINSVDLDAWNGETAEETTQAETKSYSDEDYEYLVMVLTGECQTCSFDTQLLYGSVVLNRVASSNYPNSVKEVCLDKHYGIQYSSFYDGNAYREASETSRKAAEYLLTNGSQLPSNVVYQAEFKQGSGVYTKAGRTYFCYE